MTARWRAPLVRDVLLAVMALSAGAVDAMSWLGLGKVFSGFMTGNLIFIGAGVSSGSGAPALHALVALAAFGLGAWAAARAIPRQDPSVLWPSRVTATLFGCALVQLVFWAFWLVVSGRPGSSEVVLLAISAFAMGVQTAAMVALGVHAVFTTAATATWTVLAGDAARPAGTGIERRRLFMVLIGVLAGAAIGALLLSGARLWMPLLPVILTTGVALVARARVEEYRDPDREAISAAPHPRARGYGRSGVAKGPLPGGR
jgi:uncharacterized membrane protein YoaK (UPF0700 family)